MSPNALVDRSKLKLEGKKNLSKYLLKTGKERFQSKYTVFRNALFLDSQFSYLLASLRFAQLKPELKIQKEKKKSQTSLQPIPPLHLRCLFPWGGSLGRALRSATAPLGRVSTGRGWLEQNCHLRLLTFLVRLIKTLKSVLIQAK